MVARDANETTWYVLRYAEDYTPATPSNPNDPFATDSRPWVEDEILYDPDRGVLELTPQPNGREARLLPGLALTARERIVASDPQRGRIVVTDCDGTSRDLTCEPNVLAQPAGLAVDRRGYLYVADPAARRVVVLSLPDAHVVATLGGLQEPVDVAIGARGRIYVADREAGAIVVFSPRMRQCARFDARGGTDLPAAPRPIAVMVADDGAVLVADAHHPRLLTFDANGVPGPDRTVLAHSETLGLDISGLAREAFGPAHLRSIAADCGRATARDLGVGLARVHARLRLARLALRQRYATRGVVVTRRLDGARPGTVWHKIAVEADLPPRTGLTIETATADTPDPAAADLRWSAPTDADGRPVGYSTAVPDQLVLSEPGRFLWLRITVQGPTTATPSVRAIRAYYPRRSYASLLPAVFTADPAAAQFVPRFLSLFEHVLTGIEDRYDAFNDTLDPCVAPSAVLDWLGALVDLCLDPSWSLARRRCLVSRAVELYDRRGTPHGIVEFVELYTGVRPVLLESFTQRPQQPAKLGRPRHVLGCTTELVAACDDIPPDAVLFAAHAHRFTIYVPLPDECDEEVLAAVVERIIATNKPAHTVHELQLVRPDAALGIHTRVGVDFVIGGSSPTTRLSDPHAPTPAGRARGSALGVDTVLRPIDAAP